MKSLLLCLVCVSVFASASYTGIWKGEGVLSNTEGKAWYCDEIIIVVDQKSDRFEFGRFRYACGELGFNFNPPVLNFDEQNNTTWKDQNIGRFTNDAVDFLFKLQNEGDFARYRVWRQGDALIYQDDQIGPQKTVTIKAKLFKVQ